MATNENMPDNQIKPYTGILGILLFAIFYHMIRAILLKIDVYMIKVNIEIYSSFFEFSITTEVTSNPFYWIIYSMVVTTLFTSFLVLDYLVFLPDVREKGYLNQVMVRDFIILSVYMIIYYIIAISNHPLFSEYLSFGQWFPLLFLGLVVVLVITFFSTRFLLDRYIDSIFDLKDNESVKKISNNVQTYLS